MVNFGFDGDNTPQADKADILECSKPSIEMNETLAVRDGHITDHTVEDKDIEFLILMFSNT